jgi:hypothetical protein
VRCSLLALSSYIDTELDMEPAGELEAHLVACDRCRTALGHLREESARIGGLARVHVPDDAVHELFSQIGLIAEEDDLPEGPVHHDRPAPVEAPPWFGAERGAALPWAPRPSAHDQSQPRELIGERSPSIAVADPPELFLWDESIDQIETAAPSPPPVRDVSTPAAQPEAHMPQPPQVNPEPQPPDLSTSAHVLNPPQLAAGPNAFQRLRDAVAVRLALRRGGGAAFDSGVEIVSGAGAPKWNQRTHTREWTDTAPVVARTATPAIPREQTPVVAPEATPVVVHVDTPFVAAAAVPVIAPEATPAMTPEAMPATAPSGTPDMTAGTDEPTELQSKHRPGRLRSFLGFVPDEPAHSDEYAGFDAVEPETDASYDAHDLDIPPAHAPASSGSREAMEATAPQDLADLLNEVASLAAPLDRASVPVTDESAAARTEEAPQKPSRWVEETPESRDIEYMGTSFAPTFAADAEPVSPLAFDDASETSAPPAPGRHVRRLHSQKPERRDWNPTLPVTGRHVLPLGGPAVGAADRDRRLWLFGAVTVVLILVGLLVGRQVTLTTPLVAATAPKATQAPVHAATPTVAPLPVATPAPAITPVIPSSPTPQQLTSAKTLGTGSSGFSVADVRYGEHPHDFRLVFDMAYPDTVTGDPNTVIGFDGPTTLYVEFTGVLGASDIATMPKGQVVVSVTALPMARDTSRLIFKITLSKNAPFDAYYLSGARLVIDVT